MSSASGKPRLIVTRRLPDAVLDRAARDYDAWINHADEAMPPDDLARRAEGVEALLITSTEKLDAAAIAALPDSVRIVATFSVGLDHIDVEAARRRGLAVCNTPDVLTEATADIALLLMLGAARRSSEGERMVRAGQWTGWRPTQLLGTHLGGKRLGIVGMGRIGRAVAHRARGFGMAIHYYNRRPLPDSEAGDATYHADTASLFSVADILSLHCPATPETRHLVNAESLDRLPAGAIVVNTARGAIVDDEALIAALRSGRIAAAGLDVFDNEPWLDRRYLELENTFLLPHMGSATVETRNAMGFKALDNIDAFLAGRTPPDRVV